MKRFLFVLVAVFLSGVNAYASESEDMAQANNPLANMVAVSLHDYYIGEFTGSDDDGNQFWLRYAQPFAIGESSWVFRASLPVNSYPFGANGSTETGLGDLNALAAYLFDTGKPSVSFGLGPVINLPTATEDSLGSEKWSAGLANVYFDASSKTFQYGYLLTWQASFAGDDDRDYVNLASLQYFAFYQLGAGWYLRSAPVSTYNFENDTYSVPLGLGFGRVIPNKKVVMNMFIEPQFSVFDDGGSWPDWQIFVGFNMQFKR